MKQERATMRWAGKVAGVLVASFLALPAAAQPVILMSKGEPGAALTPGSGYIESPQTVSADGRWVVFTSAASNLVPSQNDTNGQFDVFLFDRVTKNRFLVSHVPVDEAQAGNGESSSPRISADGNWVVFKSNADDLGPADSNTATDVFLYERATGNVILVSHQDVSGSSANGSSGDQGDAQVAADGSFVAYSSDATDLVPGQIDANGLSDVFLYDRVNDQNFLVSHTAASLVTAGGGQSDSPSLGSGADGVFVAYKSTTGDLVPGQVDDASSGDIFLYGHDTQTNVLVSGRFGSVTETAGHVGGTSRAPVINSKGGFVYFLTFAQDLVNGVAEADFDEDVYGYDRGPGTLTLVSHAAGSPLVPGDAESSDFLFSLSTNEAGNLLAYVSQATNLVAGQADTNGGRDVFLWDLGTNTSVVVSHSQGAPSQTPNAESYGPALSADGSHVGFVSAGTNLVSGQLDTNGNQDAFLFEVATGQSTLVSHQFGLPTTAVTSGGGPEFVAVNGNGDYVAHYSDAPNMVAVDTNADFDVFLFSRAGATNEAASLLAAAGTAGANGFSQTSNPPRNGISADGRYVVFTSEATNLVPGQLDNNGAARDVFLYDRQTDSVKLVSHKQGSPAESGNGGCKDPVISKDGNFVAFTCSATDLVFPQSDSNGGMDVFVWDRFNGTNQLVSFRIGFPSTTGSGASERPSINGDGSLVTYQSLAIDLVSPNPLDDQNGLRDVFLWRRGPNVNDLVSHVPFVVPANLLQTANGVSVEPALNAGTLGPVFVAYTSSSSNLLPSLELGGLDPDVFVYSDGPLTSALVSRNAGGQPGNGFSLAPSISDDGNWIAFQTRATDLGFADPNGPHWDVVLHDRMAFVNRLVSHLPGSDTTTAGTTVTDSQNAQVSGDGTKVVYESTASDLVADDFNSASDVFLYDRIQATVALRNRLVSKAAGSPQTANGPSTFPQVSTDGARVAFQSGARNLAPGQVDPNGATLDVFVWDAGSGTSTVASRQRGTPSTTGNGIADVPILSGNGRFVAFRSLASNLVAADQNALDDAFLFELSPADLQIVKNTGGPAVPGAPFQYLINVRNLGPEPVTGALVTDVLPPNFLSASWTCVATGGSCTASGVGDINDLVNLPVGASLDYTVSGTLALQPSSGIMSNTARVDPPLAISDPNPVNNESSTSSTLAPNAVLELAHLDSPDPVFVSTNLAYSTTIRNAGPSIAEKVSLSIVLPPGVTFLSVDHPGCTQTALVVSCPNLGDLLPGQVLTISTVVTAPGTAGSIMSEATADSDTSIPVGPVQTFTDVVDAGNSFIEFFTVTSTNDLNTLEWRTPFPPGYDHTIIRFKVGSCPTSHTDGSPVTIPVEPGPGSYGRVDHVATNDVDHCYAAFVARDVPESVVSIGKLAKGRPFDNSGKVKYAFSTGATAVTPPGLGGSGVYVPSNDRALYAISRGLSVGAGLWVPGYVPLAFSQPIQSRPPVVPLAFGGASNVVYVGSQDGGAHAVDATKGDLDPANPLVGPLWTKGLSPLQAAPAGWFAAFGGDDDRVLIGTRTAAANNVFYALIATSGTQFTPDGAFDNTGGAIGIGIISGGASVDYANKRVYFASRAKAGGSSSTLWCLPFDTGGFGPSCWDQPLGNIDNGPVLRNGRIYVGTVAGEVIGRDAVDGASSSWSFGTGAAVRSYVVLDRTNDDLYVTAGNTVWALTDGAGAERWKVTTIPNPSIPLFTRIGPNAYVFVGGGDGKLHQIDAATGGSIQSVTLGNGGSVVGSPTYDGANGLIYVGTDAGIVYAVAVPLP